MSNDYASTTSDVRKTNSPGTHWVIEMEILDPQLEVADVESSVGTARASAVHLVVLGMVQSFEFQVILFDQYLEVSCKLQHDAWVDQQV